MFSMRSSLLSSLRGIFTATSKAAHEGKLLDRTERDIPARWVVLAMLLLLVPITAKALGWPATLGTASLCALLAGILWLWIRLEPAADPAPNP